MHNRLERHRNILDFALSSLLRRKGKNAALILVYTLIVFLLASILFFTHSLREESSIILKGAPELIVQRVIAGRHELIPVSSQEKIKNIQGVSKVESRLWGYYYDPVSGANYTLMVAKEPDLTPGAIAVGEGVSRVRFAAKGDAIEFRTYQGNIVELEIVNTFSAVSGLVSSDLILVTADDFRKLFGTPDDYATDLRVRVDNPNDLGAIAAKIADILPETRQISREEILRTYDAAFCWRGGFMITIFSGAGLAFIIFAWDKASGLSEEEKREIGILKGIGWETSDIIRLKSWEGMAVSLTAFLSGIVLAYIHVFFASAAMFKPILKGWSVIYPEFKLTPFIDGTEIAFLFFFVVVPYTAATIIPSWRAAIVDPDSVMR